MRIGMPLLLAMLFALAAADGVMEMLRNRPCNGQAVKGGGAPADFVEDHQRAIGRMI